MLAIRATYIKYIFQKKEKQRYVSVGTVRMFIEPSAKYIKYQDVQHTISAYIKYQDVQHTVRAYIKYQDVQHTVRAYEGCWGGEARQSRGVISLDARSRPQSDTSTR